MTQTRYKLTVTHTKHCFLERKVCNGIYVCNGTYSFVFNGDDVNEGDNEWSSKFHVCKLNDSRTALELIEKHLQFFPLFVAFII